MQFSINRKDLKCGIEFHDGRSLAVVMEEPALQDDEFGIRSEHVKIIFKDADGEVIDEFASVTPDEFGGMIKELQYMCIVPNLIDEVKAMDESMHAGNPPSLTQAELQGGSDNA